MGISGRKTNGNLGNCHGCLSFRIAFILGKDKGRRPTSIFWYCPVFSDNDTLTYVEFFRRMPYKENNNMTPPPAAETRELQELDVSERKEQQEPTKGPEVEL